MCEGNFFVFNSVKVIMITVRDFYHLSHCVWCSEGYFLEWNLSKMCHMLVSFHSLSWLWLGTKRVNDISLLPEFPVKLVHFLLTLTPEAASKSRVCWLFIHIQHLTLKQMQTVLWVTRLESDIVGEKTKRSNLNGRESRERNWKRGKWRRRTGQTMVTWWWMQSVHLLLS